MKFAVACLAILGTWASSPAIATAMETPNNMALIPGGVYEMGSRQSLLELDPTDLFNTDRHTLGPEDPAHEVDIDPFYIDIYETTNKDYDAYVTATQANKPAFWNNSDFNAPDQPVVGVSWKEAKSYCEWKGKRLPTEAEWEKASRGKRPIFFPWGNVLPDSVKANFNNEVGKPVAVGNHPQGVSDYGVHDLSGNVAEWVWDWHYPEYYVFSPKKNPMGLDKGQYKVIRGGSWRNTAEDIRLTYRNATVPTSRSKTVGFRCVLPIKPEEE